MAKTPAKKGMSKGWKTVLMIIIPVIIGGVVIYIINKGKRKGAIKADDAMKGSDASQPKVAADPSVFPLKKGSNNDLVKQLQNALIAAYGSSILPKYGADGDWGSETDSAMKSKVGVTSIPSQSVFNSTITTLKAVVKKATNSTRADMLVDTWNNNPATQLMGGSAGALIDNYVPDAFGAIKLTGKQLFIGKNERKPRDQFTLMAVSENGYVLLQKLPGSPSGPEGFYKADPNDITVG